MIGKRKNRNRLLLILFGVIITSFFSCVIHHPLKKEDVLQIPYIGTETLIFQSDKNQNDTIFLTGTRRFNGCYDPLAVISKKCEGISYTCKHTDPNYDRYLCGQKLVDLVADQKDVTYISFHIAMKGSWFYHNSSFSMNEFKALPNTSLIINDITYSDVKVIEASSYSKQYEDRANYAERIYWSLSKGFIGLDRKDEKWRLTEIIEHN